jgi:hypothetical protein
MAEFSSVQEKYEHIIKTTRKNPAMVWLINPAMDTPGNPVLVSVQSVQWKRAGNPYAKQGYQKFVPTAKAEPPVEAKPVTAKVEPQKTQ